jgi:hypothetical protein
MIKVNGLKGQLTQWRVNQRSAWGIFRTMDDTPTTMQVKVFARKDATPESFAASLYNVQRSSWVVIDASVASCELTNKQGHPIKHPESQLVIMEHFLRISDIQLISPAHALEAQHDDQGEYSSTPHHHQEARAPAPAPEPVTAQKQAAPPVVPPPPLLRPPAKAEIAPSTQVAPAAMPWLTPR